MDRITSRKNRVILHLRRLGAERSYRRDCGFFLGDGEKLLREAVDFGAALEYVLWDGEPTFALPFGVEQFSCPVELIQYVSPLKNSSGPIFSVKMGSTTAQNSVKNAIVLENVQDPGNVGTIIRTAAAMEIGAVVLLGDCADIYNPKTVRSTMGAIFRQFIFETDESGLKNFLADSGLPLYGAALSETATDIRQNDMQNTAIAIGSEGRGLTDRLLSLCDAEIIIPMAQNSESLNAAVAASIAMWEMYRKRGA